LDILFRLERVQLVGLGAQVVPVQFGRVAQNAMVPIICLKDRALTPVPPTTFQYLGCAKLAQRNACPALQQLAWFVRLPLFWYQENVF